MKFTLGVKNIVLAGTLDTGAFDKYFFIKNEIATEEEILKKSSFNSNGVTQFLTEKFTIIIVPNQLVISENDARNDNVDINKILEKIIPQIDVSQITGMGINFNWMLSDDEIGHAELTKKYFFTEKVKVFNEYANLSGAMFGAYLSVPFEGARMKLDMKPQTATENKTSKKFEVIGFLFNFHFEITENHKEQILINLSKYDSCKTKSSETIGVYL